MRIDVVRLLAVLCLTAVAMADQPETKVEKVGLVLSPGSAQLLKAGTETPLSAKAGDILATGDGLRTGDAEAKFLFCPSKTIQTLSASGEMRVDPKGTKAKTGKLSEIPARACALPTTLRVAVASQQHFGATLTRLDVNEIPRDKIDPQAAAELGPLDEG